MGPGRGQDQSGAVPSDAGGLADSGFQANHCFSYDGVVEDSGAPAVRFVYRPAEFIRTPDIEGHVDLDPTFQVKQALVSLRIRGAPPRGGQRDL